MREHFEAFVEAETPRLLGLAHALTGNPHDAWDLVQESLTRVGVRWARLGSQNPGGYARTTLVRLNIDRARRLRRELLPGAVPDRSAPVEIVDQIDPWLVAALAQLTPQQRAAVVLRVLEDLDHAPGPLVGPGRPCGAHPPGRGGLRGRHQWRRRFVR